MRSRPWRLQGKFSQTTSSQALRLSRAFTLVELLVVIAIIGILASLLIPAVIQVQEKAKKNKAKAEITLLANAIKQYQSHYSRLPTTAAVGTADFTYGGTALDAIFNGLGPWSTNNSEVIAILMDYANATFPDGTANNANPNHRKNTQQIKCLSEVKMVASTNDPGIGPDLVYRDPWGNPYIISLDLNYDDKCEDEVYKRQKISQSSGASGFEGLFNAVDTSGNSDHFTYNGGVMVWSLGPDKKADPGIPANQGVNRDNILSWK